MRAALYARVSTEEQAKEGVSLEAQLAALKAWSNLKGFEVVGKYVDDGYTGREDRRPELQHLMLDAKERRFDVVLVAKLDRFMRSVKLLHQYLDDLTRYGVAFIPLDYPELDTSTSVGKLMLSVLGAVAQFESDRIGERVREARHSLIESGRWPAGRPLYGYSWNKEAKRFEVTEYEAKVTTYKDQMKAIEARMPPAGPKLQLEYRDLQTQIDSTRALLEGSDWFDRKHTKVWASLELFDSSDLRAFMDKFQIKIWAFPDRIEVRGMIPTQVVQQVYASSCRSESG